MYLKCSIYFNGKDHNPTLCNNMFSMNVDHKKSWDGRDERKRRDDDESSDEGEKKRKQGRILSCLNRTFYRITV